MKIDLKPARLGNNIPIKYYLDLSELDFRGEKPFKTPVHIEGVIKNQYDILHININVSAIYETVCSRCLKDIKADMKVGIDNVISENDDLIVIERDMINLDELIIPSIIIETDMTHLCNQECMGLCQGCGVNLNISSCSCNGDKVDDRLAILKTLLKN